MEGVKFCDRKGNGFRLGLAVGLASSLVTLVTGSALADEPRSATEPRVMQEPGEVVNVIDAFDDGDPFDIAISLGFQYSTKSAKIQRETNIFGPGLTSGGFTSNLLNVASYSEQTSRLIPRVDIGVYKDLAVYFRAPIILNNSRELTDLDGSSNVQNIVLAGAPGEQLFGLPFTSPDRSGLEYLAVGIDTSAFMNQARDRTKPTLLFGVEGRFALGTPMHACNTQPATGQLQCAHPSDIDRDGVRDGDLEGFDVGERDPGVTRGTIGLEVHTLVSKRIKYLEPYGGFSALFEFQQEDSDYGITDLEGSLVNRPPIRGTMTLGLMIIPWENREKFGRLTFDMRVQGTYTSEGRDYSEIFDAIGSSSAGSMRQPQWAKYQRNPNFNENAPAGMREPISIIDQNSQKTYVTGLTDVQQYASIRGQGSVTWQASEFVKFTLGIGFTHDQKHGISGDQPCNPTFKDDIGQSGPCKSGNELNVGEFVSATGIPNPNYRPTINAVGRRFWVSDSNTFDVFASGVVMF
ncbi:hypothetical protein [Polyangium spumosum]|uniref:DUF1302 family protein n=1 Tax=Polyangium spumosum TaxID=889282 RepID=A0A6N7PY20_9BACT|nr:hypothetical protein [Polyangium spumosum]MRG96988.1 hypothetical protein [Polyangium spumosum]